MFNSVNGFRGTNTVRIVGISITIKALKLTSLFPSQSVTEVLNRVALSIVLIIILLFARNVNRADDISVAVVDIEKLRTSNEVRRTMFFNVLYWQV